MIPPLFSVLLEMGLQMEHFRGPTKTLSEFVTLALTVELREREKVCGGNGSIFRLFIPGFWALFENIETHSLFAFLEFLHTLNLKP